ncbi:cytochrome bd-I oxidase subunit CydH [Budvicia aquatica]|uniref:YnhF family membrane protein n=1 Tax=Budvicia aquatica TaxID=82979 RepID=A0A2C6DQN9_9GAMM|nr:hypothetical protein CRN84_17575 [Budvicia aquatica]VFS51157.1 Uncharacterised protein [Budvicia aquatica]
MSSDFKWSLTATAFALFLVVTYSLIAVLN